MDAEKMKRLLPIDNLKAATKRFPVSFACSLVLFLISEGIVVTGSGWLLSTKLPSVVLAAAIGYFIFITYHMQVEKGDFPKRMITMATVAFYGLIVTALFLQSGMPLIYTGGALLLASILSALMAPYIYKGDDVSAWYFSRTVCHGASVAVTAGALWSIGLIVAFAAIFFLFGISAIGFRIVGTILNLSIFILIALYILSWIPKNLTFSKDEGAYPSQLTFLLHWVLTPLAIFYLLILYAYGIKQVFLWELPKGYLALMTSGFGIVAIITYIVGYPVRHVGGTLFSRVQQYILPGLILPSLVLLLAVGVRIAEYGVTEDRYLLVICGVWFLICGVSYRSKHFSLRFIPLSLIALLVLTSFGPWSVVGLSGHSQTARLEKILEEYGALKNGTLMLAEKDMPFDARKDVSSILQYLQGTGRLAKLEYAAPLMTENALGKKQERHLDRRVLEQIGIEHVSRRANKENHKEGLGFHITFGGRLTNNRLNILDVRQADYYVASALLHPGSQREKSRVLSEEVTGPHISYDLKDTTLRLDFKGEGGFTDTLAFDIAPVAAFVDASKRTGVHYEDVLYIEAAGVKGTKGRIQILRVTGRVVRGEVHYDSLNFSIFIDQP